MSKLTTKTGDTATNNAVIPQNEEKQQLALAADNDAFAEYANAGMENVKSTDILIPRINILQTLSPQVNPKKPEFIEGAKIGQICDVGTGTLIGDACLFVPVHYAKVWLEWYPRDTGKGLAAIHTDPSIMNDCSQNDRKQFVLPDGNIIQETAQLFGLDVTLGSPRQCFIPFASTQIKKCKRLLTFATSERIETSKGEITPPLFYRAYVLGTVDEGNSQGDWVGWKVERGPTIQELPNFKSIMEAALKMRSQIDDGAIQADMSGEEALDATSAANYEEGAM